MIAISETLRKRKEAFRSNHPTHSVASIGNLAEKLTKGHEDAVTPCGKGTPYVKITEENGKILFLVATLDNNTTFTQPKNSESHLSIAHTSSALSS